MALWADALLAFAYAYDKLVASQVRLGMELVRPNVSCTDGRGWPLGIELYTKFNQVLMKLSSQSMHFLDDRFPLMESPGKYNLHPMENELDSSWISFIYLKAAYPK